MILLQPHTHWNVVCYTYMIKKKTIYVVVHFYLWFELYFPLFWGILMYGNEFKKREIKFKPRIKLNHHIYNSTQNCSKFCAPF